MVLVGGSSPDFEVPQLVTDALAHYRLVAGRGNIRGTEGPRNAVATGLILSGTRRSLMESNLNTPAIVIFTTGDCADTGTTCCWVLKKKGSRL